MFHVVLLQCTAVLAADYDSPVAENGDLTEKYFIIQKVIREMLPQFEGCVIWFLHFSTVFTSCFLSCHA